MFDIIKRTKIWFTISGILMAVSLVFIAMGGIRLGIDFTGGSLMEVSFQPNRPEIPQIEEALLSAEIKSIHVQPTENNNYLLRFETVNENKHAEVVEKINTLASNQQLTVEELRFESIGPIVGQELKTKAIQAIIIVLICIVLYIAYAFRKVSQPVSSWKYGLAAIIALFHDILIPTGIFAALGYFLNWEIDILFVTALLTILGFSVHDTIVTFDRIREKLFREHNKSFEEVVNISINETIVRSINTSLTTMISSLAVYIFGGETIKNFMLVLIIGFIVGTYSSIFIASPILVIWNKFAKK